MLQQADILHRMSKTEAKKRRGNAGEQLAEALDKFYDKRFPVIPNAKKGQGGVKPTQKMIYNKQKD